MKKIAFFDIDGTLTSEIDGSREFDTLKSKKVPQSAPLVI